MIRPLLNRVFPQALTWAAAIALCAPIAIAQNSAQNADQAQQANAVRTDGQIEMDVVRDLDASAALKNDLITAATIQSQVTLSGTVSTQASRDLAGSIAGHVPGVSGVRNNLKVGNPQADAQLADAVPEPLDNGQPGDTAEPASQQPQGPDDAPMPPANQSQNQPQDQYPVQPQYQSQDQPQGQYEGQYSAQPQNQPQGQYPQGQYEPQQPYPSQPGLRPQYQPGQPPVRPYRSPAGPVTLAEGTVLQLRTNEPLDGHRAQNGQPLDFTVIRDVAFGGMLVIPRGATVHGVVAEVRRAGQLAGSPELALTLTALDLGGQSYPLQSDQFKVLGPSKTGQTVGNAFGGAILGALIGGAVGRGPGAAIGAIAGAGAGTAASAASPGPRVWIPAEARVDFHLTAPITVSPVSQEEASRLAQGLYQGGPNLYRRPPPPYAPYYGRPRYAAYPYGYPPVYYRPYYAVGGYYYWR